MTSQEIKDRLDAYGQMVAKLKEWEKDYECRMTSAHNAHSIINKLLAIAESACENAIAWAGKYHSLQECWEKCERGDWLLWFADNIGIDRKILVLAACD